MPTNQDFNPLERLLGGFDTELNLDGDRIHRGARAMLEAHLIAQKDLAGCFAYVGWPGKNVTPARRVLTEDQQREVYAAFAEAAVARRVYLGALEPDEGFGLACWPDGKHGFTGNYIAGRRSMERVVAHAVHLLGRKRSLLAATTVAIGSGRLRGETRGQSPLRPGTLVALRGPKIVERLYGEVPNRCGAIAKGKDAGVQPLPKLRVGARAARTVLFFQPWTKLFGQRELTKTKLEDQRHRRLSSITLSDHCLWEIMEIKPAAMPQNALLPYLVGLSLDFAQSRQAYDRDAHRTRAVVDEILRDFGILAEKNPAMFISPRYGDGVAAVVTVEATSLAAARVGPWLADIRGFVWRASRHLGRAHGLGLRVGLAVDRDQEAFAPRLGGLEQASCTAVETLGIGVITRARDCHPAAKKLAKMDPRFAALDRAVLFELDAQGQLTLP